MKRMRWLRLVAALTAVVAITFAASLLEAPPVTGPYRDKHAIEAVETNTLDSLRVADANDTTRVLPDRVTSDTVQAVVCLGLPLWNNRPGSPTVGETGLDTAGTDTVWVYSQDGWYSLAP